ncbi:MAG: SDR family oxidoreductase [Rhizobiaceae bacterium]
MFSSKPRRAHRILVTGASDGIGLLLARAYARRGHHVLATGRRHIADEKTTFRSPNVIYRSADLSEPEEATRTLIETMQDIGWRRLDLAILNGATAWVGPPEDEPVNGIRNQLSVNFSAAIHLAHALAPLLFVANGQLMMVGSTSVNKAQGAFATYTATKAGLDGLCRSLAEEWQGRADVKIVHPGPTRTNMHAKAGLKLGLVRLFFMSPRRVSSAIQCAVRRKDVRRRVITRFFGFRARFSRAGKGRL